MGHPHEQGVFPPHEIPGANLPDAKSLGQLIHKFKIVRDHLAAHDSAGRWRFPKAPLVGLIGDRLLPAINDGQPRVERNAPGWETAMGAELQFSAEAPNLRVLPSDGQAFRDVVRRELRIVIDPEDQGLLGFTHGPVAGMKNARAVFAQKATGDAAITQRCEHGLRHRGR